MVDMSMSMFSYGMLEVTVWQVVSSRSMVALMMRAIDQRTWRYREESPHFADGLLEGSGMSIVLDMIATLLSDGASLPKSPRTTATNTAFHKFLLH